MAPAGVFALVALTDIQYKPGPISSCSNRKGSAMKRLALLFLLLLALPNSVLAASRENPQGVLDVEVMKVALHTSTEQENGFLEYVVARVEKGTLPLDLVESTFLWAKKKPKKRFYYFREGLIRRAAERGIKL